MESYTAKKEVVITPRKKTFDLQLNKIVEYRSLIYMLVKRDFVTYYKQTILGPLWYLVQPICSTIMFIIVFGNLAGVGTDSIPQPLFYYSGTMLWSLFTANFTKSANTFSNNKGLFGKVYFPRIVVPIADAISNTFMLLIQLFLFLLMYVFYLVSGKILFSGIKVLLSLVMLFWIIVLSVGIGMIITSITTKYRDIALAINFILSLIMYATPVAYPLSEAEGKIAFLLCINPLSAPIELFRYSFFGIASVPTWSIVYSIIFTLFSLFVGIIIFNRNERSFIDVI